MTRFAWAACHLGLVGVGAGLIRLPASAPRWPALVEIYRGVSGVFTSYAFFAPDVPPAVRVRFRLEGDGMAPLETELAGRNGETAIRVADVAAVIREVAQNESAERAYVASLAAKELQRHPRADRIEARVEVKSVPTMAAALRGKEVKWVTQYEAELRR